MDYFSAVPKARWLSCCFRYVDTTGVIDVNSVSLTNAADIAEFELLTHSGQFSIELNFRWF